MGAWSSRGTAGGGRWRIVSPASGSTCRWRSRDGACGLRAELEYDRPGASPGPGLPRARRVPRLVGRGPPVVRDRPGRRDARLPARRAGAGDLAGDDRPVPGAARRGRVPPDARRSAARRGELVPGPAARPAAPARRPAAPPRAARQRGAALARRRPAYPHGALRRRHDRARAGPVRGRAGPRLPRDHRPQHDQPPRGAAGRRRGARDHPAARPGGDGAGRATRTRSATSAGSTSASPPTPGWTPRSGRAGCCRSTTRSAGT